MPNEAMLQAQPTNRVEPSVGGFRCARAGRDIPSERKPECLEIRAEGHRTPEVASAIAVTVYGEVLD